MSIRIEIAKFLAEEGGDIWEELPDKKPRKHYLYMDKEQYQGRADIILTLLEAEVEKMENPYKSKEGCFGYQTVEPAMHDAYERFRDDLQKLLEEE